MSLSDQNRALDLEALKKVANWLGNLPTLSELLLGDEKAVYEGILEAFVESGVAPSRSAEELRSLIDRAEGAPAAEGLKLAISHIEHMAAWIGSTNRGEARGLYSFEALGEDMPSIKAALATPAQGVGTQGQGDGWRDIESMRLINALRSQEGDDVLILCDNPDGPPNNVVECCGSWTRWGSRRFTGETLLDALSAAYIEYQRDAALPSTPREAGQVGDR